MNRETPTETMSCSVIVTNGSWYLSEFKVNAGTEGVPDGF